MQIKVETSKNYTVFINELSQIKLDSKVAIVTNSKVAGIHLNELLKIIKAKELIIITLKDGEIYKNFESLNEIIEHLSLNKFDRKSYIIAFGGGVISDISAFSASIYQRGINLITIPTTLLSQVDASVGGKTAINTKFGKNLIGSFYQPNAVYCETKFLKTLPIREFNSGFAEIIKIAAIYDKKFFDYLQSVNLDDESLAYIILHSIKLKAQVVKLDEKEFGIRAILNYGHSFAHVIEKLSDYKSYLHGEAVAIGINMANELSVKLGLLDRLQANSIKDLLVKFGLDFNYKVQNSQEFYEILTYDKKVANLKINFVLCPQIGSYLIKDDIDKTTILELLEEF